MASSKSIPALPATGSFAVNLAPSLLNALDSTGKKRRRAEDELIGFKYAFKPASITPTIPGVLTCTASGSRQLAFTTPSGGEQVFEAKEEAGRTRECVMIWDEESSSFTLHCLPTTLSLTLNRSLSSSTRREPAKPPSAASSDSSSSVPLAKRRGSVLSAKDAEGLDVELPKAKRSRPSEVAVPSTSASATSRSTKAGKSLPRKTLAHAPLPTVDPPKPAKTKPPANGQIRGGKTAGATGRGGKKTAATKPAAPSKGKFKSAEMIEDSDDDADGGNDLEDEFARMVGESLAGDGMDAEGEDDEDEEEEDEDDGELGGARLVVRDEAGGMLDDHSEWL